MVQSHNGLLHSRKKAAAPTLHDSMHGTGVHAKRKKPGSERQIPYDLTYKWNLISKANKQNVTRDIEIKNKLTVTREEVGGDNGWGAGGEGKGHHGKCIKDPWRKPKGVGLMVGGKDGGAGRSGGGEMGTTVLEQQ